MSVRHNSTTLVSKADGAHARSRPRVNADTVDNLGNSDKPQRPVVVVQCCLSRYERTPASKRMKPIDSLNNALDNGAIKQIFDHVRNFMIAAFILAIGTTEFRQQEHQFFYFIPPGYAGLGVIGFASVLILLNLYDGIRRISKSKYHLSLTLGLVLLYLFLSVRVVEMAWDFRDLAENVAL